jgi:transcriptional regulator with XRE-family HTH domain
MAIGSTIRYTRNKLGLSLRQFGPLVFRSFQLIQKWETGENTPDYTDMYYIYTHAALPELREMAAAVMCELDPARAKKDTTSQPALVPPLNNITGL